MKKVYLFCSAGMSTSMLASAMQSFADSKDLPYQIKAFPHDDMAQIITEDRPDCILLGPQIKYLFEELQTKFKDTQIPIQVINSQDYGTMDGEAVLKSAVILMRNTNK